MKKLSLWSAIGVFFLSAQSFATDRFVDASLSEGNGTTLFTNVSAAVEAAEDGDRIVMTPDIYPEPTIVISKSLTFIPSDEVSQVGINANFTIQADADRNVKFYNIAFGAYNTEIVNDAGGFNILFMECQMNNVYVNSNSSTSNRSECHIIDCLINSDFICERDGWDVKIVRTRINDECFVRFGDIVQSEVYWMYFQDESGVNISDEYRHSLIQNEFYHFRYLNDNHPVLVANNSIRYFWFNKYSNFNDSPNMIVNNHFTNSEVWGSGGYLAFPHNPPYYNYIFANNDFQGDTAPFCRRSNWDSQVCDYGSDYNYYQVDVGAIGFIDFSYNGYNWNGSVPGAGNALVLTAVAGPDDPVDGGSPEHQFYDLDLTVNDRGRAGGTWGYDNFPEDGDGKAFIYDLRIPTDLYPGQDINLKAKAYHRY
jgi:hypothetical protein